MTWYNMQAKANKGTIHIYQEIGDYGWGEGLTAKQFIKDLNSLGDVSNIDIHINSPGGFTTDGVTIYNELKRHKATITVYVMGLAASIASVIAMAGDKIVMPTSSMMMIHNAWGLAIGDHHDLRKTADYIEKVKESIISAYEQKTGQNREKISKLMDAETWMTAQEAIDLGFADEVEEDLKIAACASFDLSKFNNPPTELKAPLPVPQKTVTNKHEDDKPMNLEELKEKHPEAYAAAIAEGEKKAKPSDADVKAAADKMIADDRARCEKIEELALPGNEELVAECKKNGASVADFAIKQAEVEKQKQSNMLNTLKNEAPKPVPEEDPGTTENPDDEGGEIEDGDTAEEVENKLKAQWKKDKGAKHNNGQPFALYESFVGWMKAQASNKSVKLLSHKK